MTEYLIRIPRPHAKQALFLDSPAKRRVIVAGRRGGKTTGAAILAADALLDGLRVLEAAPVQDQTEAFWQAIQDIFREPIQHGAAYLHKGKRLLELPNGGRLRCKTAHNADTLRSDHADLLILDEYSLMHPDAWDKVGAPMMLDTDGTAVFIFTPQRRNHAYRHYLRAKADEGGRWGAWHFTSHDNPHLSKDALNEIISEQTDEGYRQEIMAEFLEGEGAVFRNIEPNMIAPLATYQSHYGHRIVGGIDWGKQSDYTVASVACADCSIEVDRRRFNKIDYTFQRARIGELDNTWRGVYWLAESNAMGEPIIDELRAQGLHVQPFKTTAQSKPALIENLVLTLERQIVRLQPDPIWTAELEAYERKVSHTTGRSTYSAPEGMHDDTVIARALMVRAVGQMAGGAMVEQPLQRSRFDNRRTQTTNGATGSRWKKY